MAESAFLDSLEIGIDTLGGGVLLDQARSNAGVGAGGVGITSVASTVTPLQPGELIFCAAHAETVRRYTAADETPPLSPLSMTMTAHTDALEAASKWLEMPRGMKRLSGEQRADFDSIMRFSRQREGELHQAVFLPRIVSVAFDSPSSASVDADISRDFIERVKHAIGGKKGE